jgi:3D (Asp-Asp-Asp) domain-containing protein
MRMRRFTAVLVFAGIVAAVGCSTNRVEVARPAPTPTPPPAEPPAGTFHATAYSVEGKTATGAHTREGIVAADPKVLPLGSRIRVTDAGAYSGEYVVKDTGRAINGHEIDIYLANDREAKRFGKRTVKVQVLERGGERVER